MKAVKVLKWTGIAFASILVLLVAFVYVRSSVIMWRTYDIPLTEIQVPTDSASIAEGFRQTRIETCNGCHGPDLQGAIMHEDLMVGRLVSANLTQIVAEYTDAELYRAIRHGVKKDGKVAFAMPTGIYYDLKEEVVLDIIAYLRTLEPLPNDPPLPTLKFNIMPRAMLAFGQWIPEQITRAPEAPKRFAEHFDTPLALGEYLAHTSCAKCHGSNLEGEAFFKSPGLGLIVMYDRDNFYRLIRNGKGIGDREVGNMTTAAEMHLKYFTDEEVDAVFTYLKDKYDPDKMEASNID